jgi:hypothetical protein
MKFVKYFFFLFVLSAFVIYLYSYFLLDSGSIKGYCFISFSKKEVKAAVERVVAKHPYLRDTTKFKETKLSYLDGFYYCTIKDNREQLYILKYQYTDTSLIGLQSGGKYGEGLLFPEDIGIRERRVYIELFEEHFISKLKEELNCSDCGKDDGWSGCD